MPSIKNVDLRLRGMTVMFVLADTTTDKRQSTDISLISMQSAIRQSTGKGVIPSRQITGLQKSVTKTTIYRTISKTQWYVQHLERTVFHSFIGH